MLRQDTQGLRADVRTYAQFFQAHTIVVVPLDIKNVEDVKAVEISIHLEYINPAYAKRSRINFLMVNHEYFGLRATRAFIAKQMDLADGVLLKTRVAGLSLRRSGFNGRLHYTRHTSPVPHSLGTRMDFNRLLHFAGRSNWKQTDAIMRAWLACVPGKLPPICIVCHSTCLESIRRYVKRNDLARLKSRGVTLIKVPVSDADMWTLKSTHGIHLCPSIVEGYGHYINEARGLGALVVTVDAPPMNELIGPESGVLVPCDRLVPKPQSDALPVDMCILDPGSVRSAVERVFRMTTNERAALGKAARKNYCNDTRFFKEKMRCILNGLPGP